VTVAAAFDSPAAWISLFVRWNNPPPVDPEDLLIFARVAEQGSFSRTAEQLGLPKSTVSRRLAALERQLGERLLLRTTRRLAVTEFGHELLAHARQLQAELLAVSALRERRQSALPARCACPCPAGWPT
jgi:DNA-binding transcriptional LysR family regulator